MKAVVIGESGVEIVDIVEPTPQAHQAFGSSPRLRT